MFKKEIWLLVSYQANYLTKMSPHCTKLQHASSSNVMNEVIFKKFAGNNFLQCIASEMVLDLPTYLSAEIGRKRHKSSSTAEKDVKLCNFIIENKTLHS